MQTQVETLERDAELLRAVAHPTRLALLEAVSEGEECVCHLSCLLGRPQPYISKQLGAAGWILAYQSMPSVAEYLAYGLLGLDPTSHLGAAVGFFLDDASA